MARLVLIGSGETAPTLIKVHRELLTDLDLSSSGAAALVDTTFSFQTNAEDLIAKTQRYFANSVGLPVAAIRWPRRDPEARAKADALLALSRVRWLFAGPGSPSHTMRQWVDTEFAEVLRELTQTETTLVFGSAAACTTGTATLPVYEIYKAGQDPFLLDGLNLLGRLSGLSALVIPHFDNAEGDHYDTRFCYLGAERLHRVRALLAPGTGVLGIDEHTAVIIEPTAERGSGVLRVLGHGTMTLLGPLTRNRSDPDSPLADALIVRSGETITWDQAGRILRGQEHSDGGLRPPREPRASVGSPTEEPSSEQTARSLAAAAAAAGSTFDQAARAGDVTGCVNATLDLARAIEDWSTDSLQNSDLTTARRLLHSLIVRLGDLAVTGPQVHSARLSAVTPLVAELLRLREQARAGRDFATADQIRKSLTAAGVTVADTPAGTTWELVSNQSVDSPVG